MEIGLIFKIAAVGILVTILSQVLKHSGREEHAFLISLAGLILVLSWIVPYIYELFETMQSLFACITDRFRTEYSGIFFCVPDGGKFVGRVSGIAAISRRF